MFTLRDSIRLQGKIYRIDTPWVMGILNLTPDSFYDGGSLTREQDWLYKAEKMLGDGADLLDLGGQSTRPGSIRISSDEELKRVIPAIKSILKEFPNALISIDTYHSKVAEQAVGEGAVMVNDISAGSMDPEMFNTVSRLNVPYILMHMQGVPETMQKNPGYDDVLSEMGYFFSQKINQLKQLGVSDIILDPGFGFGKRAEDNIQILAHLEFLQKFRCPILVGISRKKMIQQLVGKDADGALNGTTATNTIALLKRANLLRVHDVAEAVEVRKIVLALQAAKKSTLSV